MLWAAGDLQQLLRSDYARERYPKWFEALFKESEEKRGNTCTLTPERADEIISFTNDLMRQEGSSWLEQVFAFKGFEKTKLAFEPKVPAPEMRILVNREVHKTFSSIHCVIEVDGQKKPSEFGFPSSQNSLLWGKVFILDFIVRSIVFGDRRFWSAATYIPAARTGLMLAMPSLVSEKLGEFASEAVKSPTLLNRPTSEFLRRIPFGDVRFGNPALARVADWLEAQVLHGNVMENKKEGFPSFTFQSLEAEVNVPLHAASSMVTELAPFLITLRKSDVGLLVFEEPEAHLHLSAQRLMAQALARIVNIGVPVIVTSHSDTFVQEINNLMQLYAAKEKIRLAEELGYKDEDLIDPALVKGYEFVCEGGATEVVEVEMSSEGLIVPSLNDAIRSLALETIAIQEGSDGDDA